MRRPSSQNWLRFRQERGAISAEFALALPAVSLVLIVAVGALGVQLERLRLVDVAASMARGLARAEPIEDLYLAFGNQLAGVESRVWRSSQLVCIELTKSVDLPGLPENPLRLAETSCQREIGL